MGNKPNKHLRAFLEQVLTGLVTKKDPSSWSVPSKPVKTYLIQNKIGSRCYVTNPLTLSLEVILHLSDNFIVGSSIECVQSSKI